MTTTVCEPVCVTRKVVETKMVCTPRVVCKQVPVEVCVKVPPLVVHCPSPVLPSSQSVLATGQASPQAMMLPHRHRPDRRQPIIGRLFR